MFKIRRLMFSYTGLVTFIILFDQFTKWWVERILTLHEVMPVFTFFNLRLTHNEGIAFSFFNHSTTFNRWLLVSVSVVITGLIIFWFNKARPIKRWQGIALALIIGGAIGNIIDRAWLGYVRDFIDLHWAQWHFAIFNIADSAITIGAVMMVIDLLWQPSTQANE